METTETPKRKEQPFIGFLMMAGLVCWLMVIYSFPIFIIPALIGVAILYFKEKPLHRATIPAFAIFPLPFVCASLLFVRFYNPVESRPQQANTEQTAPPPSEKVNQGQVLHTRYFDVTLNAARITDRVSVGNEYLDLPRDAGNNYLILNVTFINTDNESRMLSEGSVIINYNGKDYLFDKSETVMVPGWGMLFDQINPMVTKTTNLVYKIPADISGPAYYNPGRSDREQLISIGDLHPFHPPNRYN